MKQSNNIKTHIPNSLTCLNLFSGTIAIVCVFNNDFILAFYWLIAALVFDFSDGYAARGLKVSSPIGKELDSLADMVSFGVLPGVVIFKLLSMENTNLPYLPYLGFIITVFSALRLAKFNLDARQTVHFIGLPTPANTIFITSIGLVTTLDDGTFRSILLNKFFLITVVIVFSYLLVSEISLFSLKFKSFSWRENRVLWIFLISLLILFLWLKIYALPLSIIYYILYSVLFFRKANSC